VGTWFVSADRLSDGANSAMLGAGARPCERGVRHTAMLALDDHVHEDQTPPDDTEMTFYPLRPWAPPDNAAGARNPRQRAPATRKPMKRRISKIEARRRHNAKIMSMYLEVFGITSVS
jgi:hypothetical protein